MACALALSGFGANASGRAEEEVYELPPFTVTAVVIGPAWRYAEIPGYEILSQCSDSETRAIAAALWHGPQLVLPPEFRPHFSLPMTVVLFNQPPSKTTAAQALELLRKPGEGASRRLNLIKRTLEDRESLSLNLWPGNFDVGPASRFGLFTLLRRHAPAAPAWLNEGLFGDYGLYHEGVYWYPGDKEKAVPRGTWCSPDETQQAKNWAPQARERLAKPARPLSASPLARLVPELPAILAAPAPKSDDPNAARWACTAALFARWGLYGGPPARAEQFWRFADRACREPVTETMFRECFGQSFAEVHVELSWYLAVTLADEATAPVAGLAPLPKLELRDATDADIARLRGEWQRMEAVALAPHFPDLAKEYRQQAASVFDRVYKKGSREPRLLASIGLLAMDSGEFEKALQYLEAAVAGHVAGPRVYLEVARLHWAARRLDDTGALGRADLAGVSDLLLAAEQQGPPMASVYLLLAKAVGLASVPTVEQAAALERGRKYFPRRADVQQAVTAALHLEVRQH